MTLTIDRDGTNYPRASADSSKIAVPVSAASVTNYTDAAAAATIPNYTFPATKSTNFRDFAATGHPGSAACRRRVEVGIWPHAVPGRSVCVGSRQASTVGLNSLTGRADRAPAVYVHSGTGHADPGAATIYVGVNSATGKIRHYVFGGAGRTRPSRQPRDAYPCAAQHVQRLANRIFHQRWDELDIGRRRRIQRIIHAISEGAVFGILTDTTFRARYSGFS